MNLDDWLNTLRYERQLAAQSLGTYERILRSLLADHPDLHHLDAATLQNWLVAQAVSARTLSQHRSALRNYFSWLQQRGARPDNPAAELRIPKIARGKLPATFTPDELRELLIPPADGDTLACRDHAILETLYSTGLRLAELVALDAGDVRGDTQELLIRGKGGHERLVYFGSAARRAIARWLVVRGQLAKAQEKALFVNHSGTRLGVRGVQQRLCHYAQSRLPGRRITPHMLRHSFASHLLQSSGDIRAVQELLGHRQLGTTQIYTHLDYQHLARVYDQSHPRAKRKGKHGGNPETSDGQPHE